MEQYYLHMQWHYDDIKEGIWSYTDDGENQFPLVEGGVHSIPHFIRKTFTILSVKMVDEKVVAEVYIDYHTVTVEEGGTTTAHASGSYCAAGDTVEQSLSMTLSIVREQA